MQIHRTEVPLGQTFFAPSSLTFGFQSSRNTFSVWHTDDPGQPTAEYVILGTGHEFSGAVSLVSSHVMPDGFHVFHLCQVLAKT